MTKDSNNDIYRLRRDDQILGYQKKVYNNFFYSKDLYGWSGNVISGHNQKDIFLGIKDKDDRSIFEEDLLKVFQNGELILHVVYDQKIEAFIFFDFGTREVVYNDINDFNNAFSKDQIERISHAFLN